MQFFKRVFKVVVFAAVCGINARKHHRRDFFVAVVNIFRGIIAKGDRVAHRSVFDVFDTCGDISDHAGVKFVHGGCGRGENAHFRNVKGFARRRHFYYVARFDSSVADAYH